MKGIRSEPIYQKKEVGYKKAEKDSNERCGTCIYFIPGSRVASKVPILRRLVKGSCQLVKGPIRSTDVCNLWSGAEE